MWQKVNQLVPGQYEIVAVTRDLLRRLRVHLEVGGLAQRLNGQGAEEPRNLAPDLRLVEMDGEAVEELVGPLVEAPPSEFSELGFGSDSERVTG